MVQIVTDYVDKVAKNNPDKIAFVDKYESITYAELKNRACSIAAYLIERGYTKKPIVINMEKSIQCLSVMLGVLYSGNYYTVLDGEMPEKRVRQILALLNPACVILNDKKDLKQNCIYPQIVYGQILFFENVDEESIFQIRKTIQPMDLAQIIFTSGSTGSPKGVMVSHDNIVAATESRTKYFDYNVNDIFANQFPFYFIGYLADVFCTIKNGATDYIIPKELFFAPKKLLGYLRQNHVTVLDWIAPALALIAKFGALSGEKLDDIRSVAFGGEPLPIRFLKMWQKALPNAEFVSAYGSSEFNGALFYKIKREFEDIERLPLGEPCSNVSVFLLDDMSLPTETGEISELCIKSPQLALGYWADEKSTKDKFKTVLINGKIERIYKTGDLVRYDKNGDLLFIGRKDFQVKRHGYRIELGEIEYIAGSMKEVNDSACIYTNEKILLYYSGIGTVQEVQKYLQKSLPAYMLPDLIYKIKSIPKNVNGKIDRTKLKELQAGELESD